MKTCDIIEVLEHTIPEKIGKEWRHDICLLGSSSAHINFKIDGKEYVLGLFKVAEGRNWAEYLGWAGNRLARIPAADVRPVKHGEWIVDDPGDYQLIECDQCHAQMWNHQSELPNYCYECGADMRKVVEIDQVKEGDT